MAGGLVHVFPRDCPAPILQKRNSSVESFPEVVIFLNDLLRALQTDWLSWLGAGDPTPRRVPAPCLLCRRPEFDSWLGKIPWRRAWQPISLPGEPHGQRSLAGYSP